MKSKNRKKKQAYLDSIERSGRPFSDKVRKHLYRLSKEKNKHIRSRAIQLIGLQYHPKSEKILLSMADADDNVRPYVAQALSIGRTQQAERVLWKLMRDKKASVRAFAVSSHFEVYMNCHGYHQRSVQSYKKMAKGMWKKETDRMVKASWYANWYVTGKRKALRWLLKSLEDCCFKQDTEGVWSVLRALDAVMNFRNEDKIVNCLKALENETVFQKSEDLESYRAILCDRNCKPIVLLLDEGDEGLTQALRFVGNRRLSNSIWFRSFGLHPKERIDQKTMEFVRRHAGVNVARQQIPQPVSGLWECDCIVPVGIQIREEDYPFSYILREYENYHSDGRETWEKVEAMIDQIGGQILNRLSETKGKTAAIKVLESLQSKGDQESLRQLEKLMRDSKDKEIRSCAAYAHFDVFINLYGYLEKTVERYEEVIEDIWREEKDRAVQAVYLGNLYWPGNRWAVEKLCSLLYECIEEKDEDGLEGVLCVLEDMKTNQNSKWLNRELKTAASKATKMMGKRILETEKWKPPIRILVAGEDGEFLWRLCDRLNAISSESYQFYEAGYRREGENDLKLCDVTLLEYGTDHQTFALQPGVDRLVKKDVILPIGVALKEKDFPYQEIWNDFTEKSLKDWDGKIKRAAKEIMKTVLNHKVQRVCI